MGPTEAIRLLKGGEDGVREWNQRRYFFDEEIPDLHGADLRDADLSRADLRDADLAGANLGRAHLGGANLRRADLGGANLAGANLVGANLGGADLSEALCYATVFGSVDLSDVKGLESIEHRGPSTVGADTLVRSRGRIPEAFLRGCGLTPWEVLSANFYRPELTPSGLADSDQGDYISRLVKVILDRVLLLASLAADSRRLLR
jgi:hypothetical protein